MGQIISNIEKSVPSSMMRRSEAFVDKWQMNVVSESSSAEDHNSSDKSWTYANVNYGRRDSETSVDHNFEIMPIFEDKGDLLFKALSTECPLTPMDDLLISKNDCSVYTSSKNAITYQQTRHFLKEKTLLKSSSYKASTTLEAKADTHNHPSQQQEARVVDDSILAIVLASICEGKSIYVGVHMDLKENVHFFFFNPEDMAACVGVGWPHAMVVLDENSDTVVNEMDADEWKIKERFWTQTLIVHKEQNSVMTFAHHKHKETEEDEKEKENLKRLAMESGETLSSLHGIGLKEVSHYIDETPDFREVNFASLHDIAFFVSTKSTIVTSHNHTRINEQSNTKAFQTHPKKIKGQQLPQQGKGKYVDGSERGEGGDEDEDGEENHGVSLESDVNDMPLVLRVIVNPRHKNTILHEKLVNYEFELPCDGLEGASISSQLVFDFFQNHERRRITITASNRLEITTERRILHNNSDFFGWYQNEIEMSLKCAEEENSQFERAAILEPGTCKLLNPTTSNKYIIASGGTLSTGHKFLTEGHVNIGFVGMLDMECGLSGSRNKEKTTSSGLTIEIDRDTMCGGFYCENFSRSESPACAKFRLVYPLECFQIWQEKSFLRTQGLFSTIEPMLTGTWIPLNKSDASPYLFCINRELKLHKRHVDISSKAHAIDHSSNKSVITYNQNYLLSFFVNHAMTHLRREKGQQIELHGDAQVVPNVLKVSSVY